MDKLKSSQCRCAHVLTNLYLLPLTFVFLQTLDEDISKNNVDLDKMRHLLTTFPSTTHLALNKGKMDHELHEMEATVHTLSARIQVILSIFLIRCRSCNPYTNRCKECLIR